MIKVSSYRQILAVLQMKKNVCECYYRTLHIEQ